MGDRSHIPANYMPIVDILSVQYAKLEQMSPVSHYILLILLILLILMINDIAKSKTLCG
jgi:hypothetical protein